MNRSDTPATWDERATLTTFHQYARATAVYKCEGLSDADAVKTPLPTSPLMTANGLVNHLRWNEHYWFEVFFLGSQDRAPWTEEDPDADWTAMLQAPMAQVLADYFDQCARSDRAVAGIALDALSHGKISTGEQVTLRWVIGHMTEETSRHNGHLDLIRELLDGTKGA